MSVPSITKNSYIPQSCPPGNVLYRITFKFKTNFSGNKLFNLTRKNFPDFTIDIPNRPLNPGDYVRYTPRNRSDPNYGKLAMVKAEINKRMYGKIQKTYDLEFISPKSKGHKIIRSLESIPQDQGGVQILTLIPQLGMYVCSSPFVPINIIKSYLTAYKAYNSRQTNRLLRELRRKGADLFDNYFKLGNNNEPLYPEFVGRGGPNYSVQQSMKKKLNREVEKIVNTSFLSQTKSHNPKIKGSGNKKSLEFSVPRDFKSGKIVREKTGNSSIGGRLITVDVDGHSINVRIPIGVKPLDRITVPIERKYNESNYDRFESSFKRKKKESGMTFLPTFITAKFSNDKHLDIHKLVRPSKNQSFKIKDAGIISQKDGMSFKFKELARFNKKNSPLVFDIEVHVDLKLEVGKSHDPASGTKNKILGKVGNFIQNSGNGCPGKMRKLKDNIKKMSENYDKSRTTSGQRSARTRKRRRHERKMGRRVLNKKQSAINRNRKRGKTRKYGGGRKKKGGEYSNLAKQIMIKQAKKYPKRYISTVESKTPGEILQMRRKTQKMSSKNYPGKRGGRRTRKKRKHDTNKIK